ncbi:MAG: hypothetical protein F4117_13300 [Acidimicrobiales bacterium]|nr:hypothetical protein [Acidimicrobiales bacterium]MYB81971.1 hypothetical protein [Acidimicrobiales bacterium]MYI13525.1 hypothetical protein [Acidimicrobiales bacterium]
MAFDIRPSAAAAGRNSLWGGRRVAVVLLALALAATAAVPAASAAEEKELSFAETPTDWAVTSGAASEVGTVNATGVNAKRIRYSLEKSRGFKIGGKTGTVSYNGNKRDAETVTLVIIATDSKKKANPATIEVIVTVNQPQTQNEQTQPETSEQPQQQQQPDNHAPQFAADTAARSVDENTPAGQHVGAPVTATDADADGDTLTYAVSGSDAFTIDASGQIAVASGAVLDYETQATHTVTVSVHDGKNAAGEADTSVDDTIAVTVSVVNVNEPGVVSLSLDQPLVGSALTAEVLDPDGVVEGTVVWQWKRSPDGTTAADVDRTDFPNIAGATDQEFLLADADAGRWLRALAIYTDPFGPGQRARAQTANPALAPQVPEAQPGTMTTVTADNCFVDGAISFPDPGFDDLDFSVGSQDRDRYKGLAEDCARLLAMKSELEGTDGDKLNWRTDLAMWQWDGIDGRPYDRGVHRLNLASKGLRGVVPEALGGLNLLVQLDLSRNELTGEIPPKLGDLKQIEQLLLGGNKLRGNIPKELGGLKKLQILELNDNALTGKIPNKLGRLTGLRELNLANQRGVKRAWDVNGPYTSSASTGPNVGRRFRFDTNSSGGLTGAIPAALWKLTELEALFLADNKLKGSLPADLDLPNLMRLNLSNSGLRGDIPSNLACQAPNLETLDLRFNKFSGQIPGSLSRLSSLRYMAFAYNDFTGVYPLSFGSLRSIPVAFLHKDRSLLGLEWGAAPDDSKCAQQIDESSRIATWITRSLRSYGQKRCEDYLGGTWVPRGTDGHIVSRCSLSAHKVTFSTETTAEIFVSRTGFTVSHLGRTIAVYERGNTPKIVTVTANEGERTSEQKWMDPAAPKKFNVHWIKHSETAFKTNYAAAGRALVVPRTVKTTTTWHKCTRRDVPGLSPQWDCEPFARNLAFKYGDPNWIPKWDTEAQKAWDDYKRDGTVTPPPTRQQPQLTS